MCKSYINKASMTLTTPNSGKWSNKNSYSWQVVAQNGTVTLEDSPMVSQKTKHTFTI